MPPKLPLGLLTEIERFQSWAAMYPPDQRGGEWECNYEDWPRLHEAVLAFLEHSPLASWSEQELWSVLYAVARDNEVQFLARVVRDRGDALLLELTQAALRVGEPDAKWQLAVELQHVTTDTNRRESLLLALAGDEHEYVRRRALLVLARLGSLETQRLAFEAWRRPDESQQWARMAALEALYRVGSPLLESLLAEALRDERPYLSEYAAKVRKGDVDIVDI